MKIINRYLLKEHVGPFVFAASALTSLMLLQYIARRFGDLVGKGLGWQVIAEFFVLSLPFTVAMTMPMAVLVSVLYAFSRLASENEITALKAGGVSMRRLLVPVLWMSTVLAAFMLFFNDQVLPRANHRLQTLQSDILRTKPTFALRPQIINSVKEGQLYMRASRVEQNTGRLQDVVIFDLSDPTRRRTIYADSGYLAFAPNQRDLWLRMFDGFIQLVPTDKTGEITRIYYDRDRMRVANVASGTFQKSEADSGMKGDREMSVCEMQQQFNRFDRVLARAETELEQAKWMQAHGAAVSTEDLPGPLQPRGARGVGALYCALLSKLSVKEAVAAQMPGAEAPSRTPKPRVVKQQQVAKPHQVAKPQQVAKPRQVAKPKTSTPPAASGSIAVSEELRARLQDPRVPVVRPPGASAAAEPPGAQPPGAQTPGVQAPKGTELRPPTTATAKEIPSLAPSTGVAGSDMRIRDAQSQVDEARRQRNRYAVEIEKKFSLAATCIIFVLVGAPIALRFPRGGVGLVLGVSFLIFALYYVGLIGGESLADRGYLSPFWAMWGANVIFLALGLIGVMRMGSEATTSRGGDLRDLVQAVRGWFARGGRTVGVPFERRRG